MRFLNLFRNPEYRKELLAFLAVMLPGTAAGFIIQPFASVLVLVLSLVILAVHLFFLQKRQKRIAELSDSIDHILHGETPVSIDIHTEGELSVLENEVGKMTVRLREQADQLLSDKKYLTSAIEDIFHQLRTPLTSMSLSVEILRNPALQNDRRDMAVRELQHSIERIRWEVETLLKMSKIDAGTALFQSKPVAVKEMLKRASSELLIPMELRDQRLIMNVSEETYAGDLLWSAEAFGNLLKNAMEHTPEGGEIRVDALETPVYTEIVVSDNGPGFEEAEIPKLFDRFFRGSRAAKESIGIGLALARMIISEQNGTISASNRKEGGARFTVRFYKTIV